MSTLDNSKIERARYEESSELEYQLAKMNTEVQILGLQAQKMQLAQQLSMAGQPQAEAPQQGQEQGGNPQEQQQPQPEQPQEAPQEQPGNPEGNLEKNLVNAGTPQ